MFHVLRQLRDRRVSNVVEFQADQRISWIPFGSDETETRHGHFHAWHFVPQGANCLVITEESGIGPENRKDPAAGSHLMHKAHELWLDSLRYVSEPFVTGLSAPL